MLNVDIQSSMKQSVDTNVVHSVGRGCSLVDSAPFVQRVAGSNPTLAATYRDLGQVLHSQLPVARRRETQAQYPCCVESASVKYWT